MTSRFKTIGLATIAVLAMSVVVTSAAKAQFTSNSYPTTVTATSPLGNDVFTVDGSSRECASHLEGSLEESSTTITVTPTYSSCKAFGFAHGTVNMNGCDYVFHRNGIFDIECPLGQSTVLTSGNCEIRVGTQTGLEIVSLSNNGNDINLQTNVSGITVNVTKDGFLCPLNGTGHKSATYKQGAAIAVKPVSGGTDLTVH